MDRATSAIAGNGMCVAVGAAALLPSLISQPGVVEGAVRAAQLDAVAVLPLVAVATFFSASTVIFGHLRRGGRRILEMVEVAGTGGPGHYELQCSLGEYPDIVIHRAGF